MLRHRFNSRGLSGRSSTARCVQRELLNHESPNLQPTQAPSSCLRTGTILQRAGSEFPSCESCRRTQLPLFPSSGSRADRASRISIPLPTIIFSQGMITSWSVTAAWTGRFRWIVPKWWKSSSGVATFFPKLPLRESATLSAHVLSVSRRAVSI